MAAGVHQVAIGGAGRRAEVDDGHLGGCVKPADHREELRGGMRYFCRLPDPGETLPRGHVLVTTTGR